MRRSLLLFATVAAALLMAALDASAQPGGAAPLPEIPSPTVGRTFHYQGCLANPDGTPKPDGSYSIRFEIIDQAIGVGDVLFTETANVNVKSGLFEHTIGSVDTTGNKINPHWFQRRVALRLTVNGETLQPVIPIHPVPLAIVALYADSLKQPIPPGPQGPPGPPGANGADGINCWDLNGNGVGDIATEDANADGVVDVLDCRGPRGPAGPPGGGGGRDTLFVLYSDTLIVLTLSLHYGPEYFIYEGPGGVSDTAVIDGGFIGILDGKGGVAVSFDTEKSVHNIPEFYIYTDPLTGDKDTTLIDGGTIGVLDGNGGIAVGFDQEKSVHNVPEYYIYTDPIFGDTDTTTIDGGTIIGTGIGVTDGRGNIKVAFTDQASYHEVPETYVHVDPFTGARDTSIIDGGTITGRSIGVLDGNGNPMVTFDGTKSVHNVPEYYIRTNPATGKKDTTILNGGNVIGTGVFIKDSLGRTVGSHTAGGVLVYPAGSPVSYGSITQDGKAQFRGLVVRDSAGNVAAQYDSQGRSFHYQPETYFAGVTVPLGNGNILRLDPTEGLTIKTPTGGFVGHLNPSGSFLFIGDKNNIVPTENYGTRKMYAVEAPDVRYTDYGSSALASGERVVQLDPMFLETVTIDDAHPMIVTLTPSGDCKGLYVARKGRDHFVVRELGGGSSSVAFDWQVVVKRRGYEDKRMEQYERAATREEMEAQAKIQPPTVNVPELRATAPVVPDVQQSETIDRARPDVKLPTLRKAPSPTGESRRALRSTQNPVKAPVKHPRSRQ